MFIGFRVNHIGRGLEAIAATIALCGLLTPGGRSLAKGIAKGATVAAKEVHSSWRARREMQREVMSAALREEMMRQMYERDSALQSCR